MGPGGIKTIMRDHTKLIQAHTDPVPPLQLSYQCSSSCVMPCGIQPDNQNPKYC